MSNCIINILLDLKEETSAANVLSSEYGFRASTMRSKIEEKISEIEEKINLPNIDSSSESLDVETRYLNHYFIVGKLFCLHLTILLYRMAIL